MSPACYHRCAKSLTLVVNSATMRPFGEHMACLRRPYAICLLILFIFLAPYSFGQTTPLLHVYEEQIKFRLNSHPVLEMPIVNTSDKALVGDFRLELLDTNSKVESFVTGTFQGKPGTTMEKVEWPLAYLVTTSPSSLGWRRLRFGSLRPKSRLALENLAPASVPKQPRRG